MPKTTNNDSAVADAPVKKNNNKPTAAERRAWYEQNKERMNYASAENALKQLRDASRSSTYRSVSSFTKENLRTYLQNISSNEKNLRNLSRYLAYRSQVYYRLLLYNSTMFCLEARSVIPNYDIAGENDKDAMLKSYSDTLQALDKMNLQYEFFKVYMTCFREDVFYGVFCFDPDSESENSFFILPLDPDYCKIIGVYETGDFAFDFDCSYLRKYPELLEYWGEPFTTLYNDYLSSGDKWQLMPPEYAVCLKYRSEDWETVVPPMSGLLNSLLSLIDQEDISAIAEEQSIYRLIWMEMETFDNGEPNDFKVDPEMVTIPYWNKMVDEALPDYTSAAIVPGELNMLSFDDDQATDTTKVEQATETVLNTAGGAQILQSANVSGTTAFTMAMRVDTEFAISSLLPQTQAVVNRVLSYYVDNPSKVKFFEVSTYTKDSFKDSVLKDNEYGLAPKLLVNSLNGFSERETLALNFLESEILDLHFTPVQSTHTTSNTAGDEGGGQEKEPGLGDDALTDEGEASRDKRDRANG